MSKLTNWAWFIGLEFILSSFILAIFLAMQSKPYPFQDDLQPFPIVMMFLCFMFMFLILMFFSREEKELDRGKGR
jgi:hypothetical protein